MIMITTHSVAYITRNFHVFFDGFFGEGAVCVAKAYSGA
jgi:hypothetical protein